MSYLSADSSDLVADLDKRKEFAQLRKAHLARNEPGISPYFMLQRELAKGRRLMFKSYQLFVDNFMNPDTEYTRLFIKHEMGTGKTISDISIALRFIETFKAGSVDKSSMGYAEDQSRAVYVLGFTRAQFERDLFRFTELGFITRNEQEYLAKLKQHAELGAEADIKMYKEFYIKLRRRLGNGKGNGYFKFIGYRELANRVFMNNPAVTSMSESEIQAGLKNGSIGIDLAYIAQFKNNLIICDEVHNVYNSLAKNNWGIAIQIILNEFGSAIRAVFSSGTLLKNSQTEIVDCINFARGTKDKQYKRADFFDPDDQLLPGALKQIGDLMRGRVSFLVDVNPKYYPRISYAGEPIGDAKYLKFERCDMPDLQERTYRAHANDIATLHEQSYIFDMVFPAEPAPSGAGSAPPILSTDKPVNKKEEVAQEEKEEVAQEEKGDVAQEEKEEVLVEDSTSSVLADEKASNASALDDADEDTVEGGAKKSRPQPQAQSQDQTLGLFKTSSLRNIETASPAWKERMGIAIQAKEKTITGAILERANIGEYSGKYARMLDRLDEIMAGGGGKVFIFHKFIHMTGVFLIGNILAANGFTSANGSPSATAKCALCGKTKENHEKSSKDDSKKESQKNGGAELTMHSIGGAEPAAEGSVDLRSLAPEGVGVRSTHSEAGSAATHGFAAARYIVVHGELDKRTLGALLEKYNNRDNTDGSKIMVVIGSRVMREAYDLMATRHVFVMSRADNIPSLLQIDARAVRANSHQYLPQEKQDVTIHIFTARSSLTDAQGKLILSYEEAKYVEKIGDYAIIQLIERELHANAIDANINRALIVPALVKDGIGHLYFDPVVNMDVGALKPEEMSMDTFNIFYREREVNDIIYVIKRLFMEESRVWRRDDLWRAVIDPPFEFEYDTSTFAESSFAVALHRLVWNNDYFGELQASADASGTISRKSIFDVLADSYDKQILLLGNVSSVIVRMGDFLMAFALDPVAKQPNIISDAPFRIPESDSAQMYNIGPYVHTILSQQRYQDLKASFMAKYKGKMLTEMTDAICMHGHDFHVMLIEEVISYVFNLWTDPKMIASAEYNAFYFQMLYYYDVNAVVIWMNSARSFVRDMYADFDEIVHVNKDSPLESLLPKEYVEKNRGELIHIARSIERSGCSWCPNSMKTRYDVALEKSKLRFAKLKSDKITATDDVIPVGHIIDDVARLYHSERGWFAVPEYNKTNTAWKENDLIVGFDSRSSGGMHIRFRLRNPKHKIKHHQDARLIERGIICTSRSREFLLDLAKKLNVKSITRDSNLGDICREIRARLLYHELEERAKGSNIKYFYHIYESAQIDI